MSVTVNQVLDVMRGWLGKSRSKGTHKDIIDIYNSYTPRARGYKVTYNDAFCDATVSAAFIKLGAIDMIGGPECGVEKHVQLFKKAGIWQEDGKVTPKPGYIIVYNWDDSTQPNDGYADHIGIVESVTASAITTMEGNISGGLVGRRTIPIGQGYIRGYAIPQYADEPTGETVYIVRRGDTLSWIAAQYGTTYQSLAAFNGIKNPNLLAIGQAIRIPGAPAAESTETQPEPETTTQIVVTIEDPPKNGETPPEAVSIEIPATDGNADALASVYSQLAAIEEAAANLKTEIAAMMKEGTK